MLTEITSFRFTSADKVAIKELASRLQMTQTDTIRFLVRETLAGLKERDLKTTEQGHRKVLTQEKAALNA